MRGEEYLTKPQQYSLVYNRGGSWASDLLVMRALANGLTFSRYGFSVSQRVAKAAVKRNRVKRLLREILRRRLLVPGWDIIFIARQAAANADYTNLEGAVETLLSRAGLVLSAEEPVFPTSAKARGADENERLCLGTD